MNIVQAEICIQHTHTACIDQDSQNPAEQLNNSLARVISSCDLMVTPVHDPEWRKWSLGPDNTATDISDAFADYRAGPFLDYLARGWCRLEMFYNAYMPFRSARAKLFGGRLEQVMTEERRRPHLVYGTRELERGDTPVILRVLREDEIEIYNPENADGLDADIMQLLKQHMKELFETSPTLKV